MPKKTNDQLYLVLKKQYFDEILAGTKTEEYRDFTDHNISRLAVCDENGAILDTRKYKTVKFQNGYSKNAPQMIVEVKEIFLDIDEEVDLEAENAELNTDNCNFTIILGKILDRSNC